MCNIQNIHLIDLRIKRKLEEKDNKMGNGGGCMSTQHSDMGAVRSGGGIGGGSDIDSAVLAATNFG